MGLVSMRFILSSTFLSKPSRAPSGFLGFEVKKSFLKKDSATSPIPSASVRYNPFSSFSFSNLFYLFRA
ncbi:uncharacterized protein DS421_13g417370 [Arachis hypogaea]|nr:uncharacterized protein DS421_13g417370 [Arachis hypogaea]